MSRLLRSSRLAAGAATAVLVAAVAGQRPISAQTIDRSVTLREALLQARAQSPARQASTSSRRGRRRLARLRRPTREPVD